jgi:hypothetical protein
MKTTTITRKSLNMDSKTYSLGLHRKFRKAVNDKIHARKFVINRIDIQWNKMTCKFEEVQYLTIVDDSPLLNEFGYDVNYKKANVLVFDLDDEDNKKTARRINIDGCKYVYCDSIIAIQADNQRKINELADKGYTLDVTKYMAATASPSNEKHSVKYYAKISVEVPDEEAIYNKIDKLMGGALSYKLTNILVDGKTITKSNTRIGNYASGMQLLATIDLSKERIAVVNGSIFQAYDFDEETMEEMKSVGINIDNHINDGAAFISPEKVMEMAANVGVKLTMDAALRICIQTRWDVVNTKVMAQPRCEEDLLRMAEFYNATIYGNPNGKLVALVDEDGAKMQNIDALKDNNTVINMYVMAVANASGVKSCGQHMIKYMAVNPEETLRLVKQFATIAMDDFVANKFESEDGGFSVNGRIMAKLSPEEIYNDSFLMETIYADAWKYAQSMIANNKMPLDGVYTHMTFDLSYALTNGLVANILDKTPEGFVEAYNPDVLRVYADDIKAIEEDDSLTEEEKEYELFKILSATVIKFPSAMPDEYEVIVYKTEKQMKQRVIDRVSEVDVDNEIKMQLKDILDYYVDHAYFGCTIYAPINAMKNKLAGADIDYDATMCDMSEFKFILINERIKEAQKQPGYMGKCTFIKYGKVEKKPQAPINEVFTELDDIDLD